MKIFIVAGGTGGHVYPALSVAREFKKKSTEVIWVGRKESLEEDIAKEEGFNFITLSVSGFLGKQIGGKIKAIFELCLAFIQAIFLLVKFKPDLIFFYRRLLEFTCWFSCSFFENPTIHSRTK